MGADIYDDRPMTEKEFHELFVYSDSESGDLEQTCRIASDKKILRYRNCFFFPPPKIRMSTLNPRMNLSDRSC